MVLSLGLFALRMQLYDVSPWQLFATIERTGFWMFFWPIGVWVYPRRDPANLVRLAFRRAAALAAFLFSAGLPGLAMAQVKSEGKKKENPEHTLEIDLRTSWYTNEGPPNPDVFARATISTSKWLVENVTVANPRLNSFISQTGGGPFISGKHKTQIAAVGYLNISEGGVGTSLGVQVYRPFKRMFLAIPVLQWSRQVNGPSNNAFTLVANPAIKIRGSWSLAPDIFVAKTIGAPTFWSIGAALRFSRNKGQDNFENGLFVNRLGQVSMRPRLLFDRPF
jgi:hypothetical protein